VAAFLLLVPMRMAVLTQRFLHRSGR
jgi:hypothetical protein